MQHYTTKLLNRLQISKSRATRIPQKVGELRCPGRVSSSCSTRGSRCVTRVTNPVISHELEKDRVVMTTHGTYLWPFVTWIFRNG